MEIESEILQEGGAGEVAYIANYLLFKCTDLSLDFQHPHRKSEVVATLYSSIGEVETEGILGAH